MPHRRLPRTADAAAHGDPPAARLAAVTLLARRDFTARELSERLIQRGFEASAAADVVTELLRDGAVDDARYAHNYVAYHAGRGRGPLRIAAELRRSGLTADLIEAALATGPDWYTLARRVCRAKFGPQTPDSWAQRARQARFLQYRGFSSDHIRAATDVESDTGFSEP